MTRWLSNRVGPQGCVLTTDIDTRLLERLGLSNVEVGLRLRYEIRREIAPYVGLHWERKFGRTAEFAREDGIDASELAIVVGLHAWF